MRPRLWRKEVDSSDDTESVTGCCLSLAGRVGVRQETYWLAGGFFSWIIAPWLLGLTMTNDLLAVLGAAPASSLRWAYIFGVLWDMGGLTFGLSMRYLGMSL